MNRYKNLFHLRILVGYLGETAPHPWWNSHFFDSYSAKTLAYTMPKTFLRAQYEGISLAAANDHDHAIGVGNTYHLFRLPELIEQQLSKLIADSHSMHAEVETMTHSTHHAIDTLKGLIQKEVAVDEKPAQGPINIGKPDKLLRELSISRMASIYLDAIDKGIRRYPYFREEALNG